MSSKIIWFKYPRLHSDSFLFVRSQNMLSANQNKQVVLFGFIFIHNCQFYFISLKKVRMDNTNYDSDEEMSQLEKLQYQNIPKGMFVSGWDDADDNIEEEKNPTGKSIRSQVSLITTSLAADIDKMILWAVDENRIIDVQECLKLDPSTTSSSDNDGYTPLHRACYNDYTDIAELLLLNNADPNAKTKMGWTPLHSACQWGHAKSVALLLQNGSDVNARSDGLQTPLHIAASVSNCRSTAMTLLMHPEVDAEARNNSEDTPGVIAMRQGLTYPIFEMGNNVFNCETGIIDDDSIKTK